VLRVGRRSAVAEDEQGVAVGERVGEQIDCRVDGFGVRAFANTRQILSNGAEQRRDERERVVSDFRALASKLPLKPAPW
jgi:hypothetical protein